MTSDIVSKLKALYADGSKHAVYQNIPGFVSEALGYTETINEEWRGDSARYLFLSQKIPWSSVGSMADIGANTGFFCLSYSHKYPEKEFKAFELNPNHVALMNEVKNHFNLSNFQAFNRAVHEGDTFDLMLYLNVLHHIGADFGADSVVNQSTFVEHAAKEMTKLSVMSRYMAFQTGYNLWGDKKQPIVPNDKPSGMLRLIQRICNLSGWKIVVLGVYHANEKAYFDLSEQINYLLLNDDSDEQIDKIYSDYGFERLSEFYKRPLLLLERK